ncbi:MAG: aminotransferase class V-fold PLP-dependent enzyme [Pararhodobacter sp.]|nr:aminotransferase class V-fold PLP-dependent enzyme [Pararhodobacter sp.]
MSLAHGRPYRAIPGPSVVPDRVLAAMHQASPNIYDGPLHDMVSALWPDLKRLACTDQHVALYIGNGHAAWEAANANVFSRGDRALVLATGRFGEGWGESMRGLGIDTEVLNFGRQASIDLNRVEAALRADPRHALKAVALTHVDTATSAKNDIAALRGLMDMVGHPALLMVDCIASMGCDVFRMDDWGVDVTVGASQKGLMLPPGLGVVWFSERARQAGRGGDLVSPWWNWEPRAFGTEFWQHFCGTAPTHHLFGLRVSLDMILHEEGLENVWRRHAALARAVWAAAETWGAGGAMALNIGDPAARGHAVTTLRLDSPDATRLRTWCEAEAGLTLGIGLGMAEPGSDAADGFFRLAHMGHVNAHMVLGALTTIEAGMGALDIAHAPGGATAAARVLAQATLAAAATPAERLAAAPVAMPAG